jgi:hypothetical protein
MDQKPQQEQKHPDQWQQDLNPDHLAGQNIGTQSSGTEQRGNTAYDVKAVHRQLSDFSDADLKKIPVVPTGARLQQGATYVDLNDPQRSEFTATGDMAASEGHVYVPKSETPYPVWNRLIGVENPERL